MFCANNHSGHGEIDDGLMLLRKTICTLPAILLPVTNVISLRFQY
jgi:hypothetical protein